MYPSSPTPESTGSIRHMRLSPLSSNDRNKRDAFVMFMDESNKLTVTRANTGNNNNNTAMLTQLPVVAQVSLSASPRSAVWCPFISQTLEETGDDVHCIATSALGGPVHLRYFSCPTKGNGAAAATEDEVVGHDPNWVEASYKFFDNMDYPLHSNTIEWHRNRAAQLLCGYDKGHVIVFDVERPGRDTAWRFQLNSVHCSRDKNASGPQFSVSALAVHDSKPHIVAVGARGIGEIPVLDTRMRQPALVLRGGHAVSAVTQIKFDPLCEWAVYSSSRGSASLGVVQHDLRCPLAPSGVLVRPPCRASMQPLDFELISPGDSDRVWRSLLTKANASPRQSQQQQPEQQQQDGQEEPPQPSISESCSVVVSGSGRSTLVVGQCTSFDQQQQQQRCFAHLESEAGNNNNRAFDDDQTPLTSVAICVERGLLCCGGGARRYEAFAAEQQDDAEAATHSGSNKPQPQRRSRTKNADKDNDDEDSDDEEVFSTWQRVKATKPAPSSALCRIYRL